MKDDAVALFYHDSETLSVPRLFLAADTRRVCGLAGRMKRLFDVFCASAILICLSPLMLLIAFAIKRSSRGPVFFIQERLGKDGRPFPFYKFRTMAHNSDDAIHRQFAALFINGDHGGCQQKNANSGVWKLRDDPRVTGVGRWLRKTSLDELPQLFNVLKGEMSLVGPRPPIAYEIEHYQPWHLERLKVVPGLTGLWQVSGRSSVSFDEMVRLDVQYINHWSLWADLEIIFKTIPVVLKGTGGY